MSRSVGRRGALSLALASALCLVIAGQALAVTWSAPIALTMSGDAYFTSGLVGLGSDRMVAAFSAGDNIVIRRSLDSGVTWKPGLVLSTGREVAISGRGMRVDVVWLRNGRVRYATSSDSGRTFSASVALSPSGFAVEAPAISRGPSGLIVVAWLQSPTAPCCEGPWNIKARVSANGGSAFGTTKTLGSGWEPAVAAGDGVTYVGWHGIDGDRGQPYVRRSLDGGSSWAAAAKPPVVDLGLVELHPSLTADGSSAYLAYNVWQAPADPDGIGDTWIEYVATDNRGASWSAAHNMTSATSQSSSPLLSLKGGVLRAAFGKAEGVYYKQSSDGVTWSPPSRAAGFGSPHGVAFAGRVGVLYTSGELFTDVWVRTGAP
jgi:hypothetical protein